ncbi:MAG TPA: DUF3592 domain-containing protein [Opitutaceae bacterium]|nr:DUF3592 domain-containing protein [Opitutaceae bacterium]
MIYIVIFIAIIGVVLFYCGIKVQSQRHRSARWPSVPGAVIDSAKKKDSSTDGGVVYFPKISYAFEVAGKKYVGDRISFLDSGTGRECKIDSILARYPKGQSVTVFYDPKDAAICVLEKKAGWNWLLIAAGGHLVAVAIYYFLKK